jgi:hypothetical protein
LAADGTGIDVFWLIIISQGMLFTPGPIKHAISGHSGSSGKISRESLVSAETKQD